MAKKRIKINKRYFNTYGDGGLLGKFASWNEGTTKNFMSSDRGTALGKLGVLSGGLGGLANGVSSTASGLINPSGNSTGVGNTMQAIGSVASNIPGIGGVIGAGVNLVGGLVNAAFGSNLNEEFIAETEDKTRQQANYVSDANGNASLMSDWGAYTDMAHVKESDVGSDGWFSNKAKNKTKELNKAIDRANFKAWSSLANTASNIDTNNDMLAMSNFAAYGGPLFSTGAIGYELTSRDLNNKQMKALGDMKLTSLPNSFNALPDVSTINTFAKGGGIHIKKKNRGKFTDYCGGKVTSECIARGKRSSSPTIRKRATFAANARKWKHADGGPLNDSQYYDIMERVADENYRTWELNSLDEALIHVLNDNAYDYRGYYNKYPDSRANADTHWDDEFKTVYHPTFSNESRYSGKKSKFNPKGLTGGHWDGDTFIPADWQRKRAEGGPLFTHGGIWDNGLTYINEGGSHEENPFEGVQMGVDPQGIPNLVEEGEVVYNDYVFSNRMKVPKDVKKRLKVRGDTFAEAAKELSKESEERPNDPISKNGLDAFMSALSESQEELRMKNENRRANRYAKGGKLGKLFKGLGPDPNLLIPDWLWYDNSTFSDGNEDDNRAFSDYAQSGLVFDTNDSNISPAATINWDKSYSPNSEFSRLRNFYIQHWDNPNFRKYRDAYIQALSESNNNMDLSRFTLDDFKRITNDRKLGRGHVLTDSSNDVKALMKRLEAPLNPLDLPLPAVNIPTKLEIPKLETPAATSAPEEADDKIIKVAGIRQSPLRYTPIIGSGLAVLNDMLGGNDPDYSNADLFAEAIRSANSPIGTRPIGEYLAYRPLDRMFYINQLNKNSAASRRAVQNTAGGNRAAALAGILAADSSYGENLGKLARQAEEYNQALRERVTGFNRQTNMFNSEQGTKVDMFNTKLLERQAGLYSQLANMRQRILEGNRAEKSANLTNFIQGLGDLGREITDRDTLRWLADIGALPYNTRGQYTGGNTTAAPKRSKGGKIKRRKGFTI